MENLSYSLSENSENTSNNDFEEENIGEMQPSVRINRYIENDSENYDELPVDNKTQKNPIKKITNRKRSSKPKDSTISQKIIPKKRTIKRKSTIQRSKNDLNNEEDINSINKIPKKRRKRSISKKIENQIEEERLENNSDLQGMKAIKHTKRDLEKTAKTTKTIIRNNDSKQNKPQNLLSSYDYSTQENDHFLSRNKFLDDEDSYEYINETEISRNDQLEIEISFAKKNEENQEKETIKDPFQNSQVEVRNIKSLNYQNGELIKPNNQKQSFQPQIEEFFYDSYSRPTKLRIDTTLVAQSNNRPLLKLSQPYQVSTFSKILESESSVDNQNNEYVLRDVIIASESESDYSSKEKSKIVKTINSNNRYNLDSNTDSEVNIKQKDTFQSRYSNISAINNDDYRKDKTNNIKFTKDKEFVININISDKFNTTHNSNSIDIETPKQITNSREVDLQKTNETSLSLLNDSNKLKPLPIKSKDVEIGKKLMVSPSINIQKNKYNLNVVNNYQNSSDTVIVRIESDSPLAKPTLQIHQTNSHQQYFSTINNSNSKNYNINPQSNNSNTRNPNDKNFTTSNRYDSDINKNNHFNSNNNSKIPNKKDKQEDPSNYHQIHKYSNESKTHRRGDSVPRHKSSNVEKNNNNNYSSQKKDKPAYEIHLHNDGSDYVGSIQFRNGKLVRRVRVRKSQRSSSVAPSNSYIRNPNNNNPYHQNIYRDNSPTKSRNYYDQNHAQYPSIGHNHHTHNQFPNDFSNYNSHHHHHYPQSENGSNHHQRRSSSVNRIRVKKSQLSNFNPQNGKENIYSRHHNHRSNSVPRNAPSPLYTDPKNREINDSSDINVRYVFSSDDNGKRNHSEKVNVSTLTNNHSIRKEKETQTPKGKRNLTGDTFSSSSDEVLHSKSIFLDLSKIDKKEEKSAKENKNPYLLENDDNQPMISSDLEINSPYRQKKVKNHSKNWNLSQSNDMEENYSFNSQSESKKRKRKRPSSRSSSRSSISISMATPSPSASDIPTSDYEIIQTPLKDFVKNKNIFISEISSQFQEEEQENENSSFRGKNKQNGSNSKNKSKHDSISNNNKAGFAKMEKSNINNLLDIASSDDDDIKYTKKNALDYSFTDNSYKKNKNSNIDHEISSSSTSKHSHRKRKRVLNELNESSNSKSKKKKNLSQNCNSDIF